MTRKWLEHILENLHSDAYQWARQCCSLDDHLAKDVLQMVYLKIVEGKAKFNEKATVKTWLFTVIQNTALDQLKAIVNHQKLDQISDVAEEPIFDTEQTNYYQKLIGELPERQRQILLLIFYHSMTLEQASEIMRVSIGTARTHYDRGKKRLKTLILNSKQYG